LPLVKSIVGAEKEHKYKPSQLEYR